MSSVTWPSGALHEIVGNFSRPPSDYPTMDCPQIRFSVSAALDGEDPGLPEVVIQAHLAACTRCRTWSADAGDFHRTLRIRPAEMEVDRTEEIRAALPIRPGAVHRGDRVQPLRLATLVIAIIQIVGAVPLLLGHGDMMHSHYARHIGVFSAALAIGLLVVAWRPERARALLPMLAVLVAGLVWSCLDDLISGRAVPGSAIAHGADVAALGVVWMLAHTTAGSADVTHRHPVLR